MDEATATAVMNSLPQPTRLDDLLLRLYRKRRAAELWPHNLDADEADDLDVFRLAEEAIKALSSKLSTSEKELDELAQHCDRLNNSIARLDNDKTEALSRLSSERIAHREQEQALRSRLGAAVALIQEVLDGTAEPVEWNPRARAIRDSVVERQEIK